MKRLIEPAILLGLGTVLLVFSLTGGDDATSHTVGHGLAWHQLAFLYGVVAISFSALSYLLARFRLSVAGCISQSIQAAAAPGPTASAFGNTVRWKSETIFFVLSATLVGALGRWAFIDQPMRLDESNTFLAFVQTSWTNVFLYPFPNNHVLNSMLERLSTMILGDEPRAIRMPAFLFGIANIVMVHALGRRLGGERAGLLAALGAACWPYLIFFSTNGRGYSLLIFLALLIPYVLLDASGRIAQSRVAIASLLAAMGMATMPSMLFVLVGLVLWMLCVSWCQSRDQAEVWTGLILPFGSMTLLITVLFYTPVALVSGGLQGVLANKEAVSLPLDRFFHQAGAHLLNTASTLTVDVPTAALLVLAVLNVLGVFMLLRERRYAAALLVPCVIVGAAAFFVLKRSIPFPRTWVFLVPFVLVGADLGWSRISSGLSDRTRLVVTTVLLLAATAFTVRIVEHRAIERYVETGIAPDAEGLVRSLVPRMQRGDVACAVIPANMIAAYYLWRDLRPSRLVEGGRPGRVLWLRDTTTRPTRGLDQGWRTMVQWGRMSADEWTFPGVPALVQSGQIDCWQPDADTRLR